MGGQQSEDVNSAEKKIQKKCKQCARGFGPKGQVGQGEEFDACVICDKGCLRCKMTDKDKSECVECAEKEGEKDPKWCFGMSASLFGSFILPILGFLFLRF